jgi:hypothetical protein
MNKHTHKKKYSESQVEEMLQTALNYMFMMYQQQNNNLDHHKYLEENNLLKNKIKYLEEINTVSNSKTDSKTENLGTVKMDLNEFEDKCDNFFKKENYENNIKKEYDYNMVILSNAIKNNIENDHDFHFENRDLFLNFKKSMIYYRYQILSILNKLNISFKCTSLKNMMITQYGGDHDNINDLYNHKISKYASKFSQSNDIKYIQKLNDYIQDGGGIIATQNSSRFLKNIVYNSYDIITDQKLFRDKDSLDKCTGITDLTDTLDFTDNDITITACIKQSTIKDTNKFNIEKLLYEFKKKRRMLSTDMGISTFKNLNNNLLNLSGKYILTLLLATVAEFMYEYNLSRKYTTTLLSKDDITVLYKGGNTTRLHMVEFYNSIPDTEREKFKKINDIISDSSVGDFDFNVSLDKEALLKRKFNQNELDIIEGYLKQVLSLCTYNIKIVLNNIMDTNFSHEYIKILEDKLTHSDSINDITKFTNDYNHLIVEYNLTNSQPQLKQILEIKLKHIMVPNYIYENNVIKTHTDPLEKNNILFKKKISDGISYNIVDNVTNYFTTNNLLETLVPHSYINNIYSVYIQGLKLIKGKRISYFDLFRLKLNNKLIYDLKYADNTQGELKIPFGIEFIDISLETSAHTIDIFCKKEKKHQIINLVNEESKNEESKNIYIPSVYYMYYDIVVMFLTETYLIWEEPKYNKRLKRLLYLAFLCNIKDKVLMSTITKNYIKFKNLLKDILKEINNDKTNFVAKFYNIHIRPTNFKYEIIRDVDIENLHYVNLKQITFDTVQVDEYNDYLYVKIYEMILYLYYFKDKANTVTPEHKKYCEDNTIIYKDIDNNNYIPDVTYLPSNIDNLTKMTNEHYNKHLINLTDCLEIIIEQIDEIIELSELFTTHGILTVDMKYDNIMDLY